MHEYISCTNKLLFSSRYFIFSLMGSDTIYNKIVALFDLLSGWVFSFQVESFLLDKSPPTIRQVCLSEYTWSPCTKDSSRCRQLSKVNESSQRACWHGQSCQASGVWAELKCWEMSDIWNYRDRSGCFALNISVSLICFCFFKHLWFLTRSNCCPK